MQDLLVVFEAFVLLDFLLLYLVSIAEIMVVVKLMIDRLDS